LTGDQLRIAWTVVGLTGSVFGIAAVVVMWWLRRDAERYAWAVSQVATHPLLERLRRQAHDELSDIKGLGWITVVVLLIVVAMTGAGFAAILGHGVIAIPFLVAAEVLAVLSLAGLVVLGWSMKQRRDAVRAGVRLG
jgi:hypothetical protein